MAILLLFNLASPPAGQAALSNRSAAGEATRSQRSATHAAPLCLAAPFVAAPIAHACTVLASRPTAGAQAAHLPRLSAARPAPPLPAELLAARRLVADAPRVSLQDAIQSTLRQNPSLRKAYNEIQARAWQLAANQRRWQPSAAIEASPGTTLLGQVFNTTVASYPNNSNAASFATSTYNNSYRNYSNTTSGSIGLMLSWSFFDPSRGPAIRGADASLKAQQLTFNVIARSLVLDTQTTYHALQETQALIVVYEEIYRQNRHQLELVQAQFGIGMTHIGDLVQKQTQLLNQLNQLLLLYRQQAQEASDLATTMGLKPGSAVLPSDKAATTTANWSLSQKDTIAEGLRLREEIQASLAESQAARWEARRLVNTYLPVLMLAGTAYGSRSEGVFNANVGENPSPYFSRQFSSDAAVGLGLRWDFLDGGIRSARAHQAEAQARALQDQAQQNRLSVANQIRRSHASYAASRLAMPSAEQAYSAAEKAVEVASKRYDVGIGTMTELIQATQLLGESAQQLAGLRLLYNNAIAELYRYSARWPSEYSSTILNDLQAIEASGR